MSSLTPSSPEPSKWTATKVIPASTNRSQSARIAAFAAACSGGIDCSEFDGSGSIGFSFQHRKYAATQRRPFALMKTAKRRLVMFPSQEGLPINYFSLCGCFERKHDLTQGLKVVYHVD